MEISDPLETQSTVSIIIPAYSEAPVIGRVIGDIQAVMGATDVLFEILVADDGSSDSTALEAERAGARIVQHTYNIGNGVAIKTGIRNARGEILVMMDGYGQHNPQDIPRLLEGIQHKIGDYNRC